MSVYWNYDQDETVLRFRFQAPWSAEEFRSAQQAAAQHNRARSNPVDLIFDFAQTRNLPPDAMTLMRQLALRVLDSQHQSIMVVLEATPVIRSYYITLVRLMPALKDTIHFASSEAEAQDLITSLSAERQSYHD